MDNTAIKIHLKVNLTHASGVCHKSCQPPSIFCVLEHLHALVDYETKGRNDKRRKEGQEERVEEGRKGLPFLKWICLDFPLSSDTAAPILLACLCVQQIK